ncbi:TPA: hypothetical protein F3L15_23460 [Aeromonas hydrophila]|nr:hypothetical protein [Aeromonas hydrophila]HAU4886941.1 hypothetical protein [Aeromonas hydrophila]
MRLWFRQVKKREPAIRLRSSGRVAVRKSCGAAPVSLPLCYGPRFYVSTSKSIIKALINMHSFEIQLSPIG